MTDYCGKCRFCVKYLVQYNLLSKNTKNCYAYIVHTHVMTIFPSGRLSREYRYQVPGTLVPVSGLVQVFIHHTKTFRL